MNLYIVVEGEVGEKYLYQNWVPLVNPKLKFVSHLSAIVKNNFSIISGGGYPSYFDVIEAAIEDVNSYSLIDRLVISVDSEELSFLDKLMEMNKFISQFKCKADIKLIIQHFCLEAWALGNRMIIRPNPQSLKLIEFKKFFNVRSSDPEELPPYKIEELNRSQFAEVYLRSALNDKFRNLSYSKSNPKVLLNPKYFQRVKERYSDTEHLKSFETFLTAFN
ncbi:hypothetical protein [uncultured Desulfosarcina sp.]|uniref:hypothetical protein n=1 Tax=uncultured Desulfosarcina sp. TaxID=218289 RepID=UPI0029C67230|nr:hypothetical protein [uncultured Desulfosarcina sp.]